MKEQLLEFRPDSRRIATYQYKEFPRNINKINRYEIENIRLSDKFTPHCSGNGREWPRQMILPENKGVGRMQNKFCIRPTPFQRMENQISSMMAISAASPRRGPSL